MKLSLIPIVAVLASCASTSSPFNSVEVLTQNQYVVRTAPDILRQLPPLPPRLANPRKATNSQVATFISNSEEYTAQLEAQLRLIIRFYESPVGSASTNGAAAPATPASAPAPSRLDRARTRVGL